MPREPSGVALLLARYLFRQHLLVVAAAAPLATLVLMAGALLAGAPALAVLGPGELAQAAGAVALRCGVLALPLAVLLAPVVVALGLRERNELVALEATGHGPGERLWVAALIGLSATLLLAESSRSLLPRAREWEREARLAAGLAEAEELLDWAVEVRGPSAPRISVQEAVGSSLRGVVAWGVPAGQEASVVFARRGRLAYERERDVCALELDDVELYAVGGPGPGAPGSVRLQSARIELSVPRRLSATPSRRRASLDALWAARARGAPWSRSSVDAELARRLAEPLTALTLALVGFVIGERARGELVSYGLVLGAAAVHLSLGPFAGHAALLGAGAAAYAAGPRREG